MSTTFRLPDGLLGRFAVVKPWPEIQAAEDENIARLQITARALGLECLVVDPEGIRLDGTGTRVSGRDVDFVIHLHFETPKAYDAFSFVVLWNPLRFFRDWGYRRFSSHLLTHDDFLSCSSTWADDHVRRMLHRNPRSLPPPFTMYHSLSEPILEPTLGERKIFYAGINWEKVDKKKKGRHQELLKLLDKDGVLRIHGPKLFNGVDVWEGYKGYVGPLPFDGVSVVQAIAQAGISLVFSSDAHKESELMSNRLFESLAAGAVIICDENPFARRFFGDRLLYVDSLAPVETVRAQILDHLNWIRREPEAARAKALAAQALFRERFTLDRSLRTVYEQLRARQGELEQLRAPLHSDQHIELLLLLPEFSMPALRNLLSSAAAQRSVGLHPSLLVDAGDARTFEAEIAHALQEAKLEARVVPLPFFLRRADGSRIRRALLGEVLAPVIEALPPEALFTILAPNDQLFSDHLAGLMRALQTEGTGDFAYAPVVLRHMFGSKFAYDLLNELNIRSNVHLPPGFGRYLFRRQQVTPAQLDAMRYLDCRLLGPLVGSGRGASSHRATIVSRIQEPFLSHELLDGPFEHDIVLDHIGAGSETACTDLTRVKSVTAHIKSATPGADSTATPLQALLLGLDEGPRKNPPVAEAIRRLRQIMLYERVYEESVFAAAEAEYTALPFREFSAFNHEVLENEKCDSFHAYCVGLRHDALSEHGQAFRAYRRALINATDLQPAQYRIRVGFKLVNLALRVGEAHHAIEILENYVLKLHPAHRPAKELLAQIKAGIAPQGPAKGKDLPVRSGPNGRPNGARKPGPPPQVPGAVPANAGANGNGARPPAKEVEPTADRHLQQGIAHYERGDYAAAASELRECLAKRGTPDASSANAPLHSAAPHRYLANALAALKQEDAARQAFQAGLQAHPRAGDLRHDFARFLHQTGQSSHALQLLQQTVAQDSADLVCWILGGQIALSRVEFAPLAGDWTQRAFHQHSGDPRVLAQRAEYLLLAGNIPEAMALWRRLAASQDPRHQAALALCRLLAGETTNRPALPPNDEIRLSQAFLAWYQQCAEWKAVEILQHIHERTALLSPVLPTAARLLDEALAEAVDQTSAIAPAA